MTHTTLILAAHGSRLDPAANELIRAQAAAIRSRSTFADVLVAFHQGTPPFATVLDTVTTRDVIVVPLMTSDGYYTRSVLPRELAKNPAWKHHDLRITDPVGTHPSIARIVGTRIAHTLKQFAISAEQSSVVIVGHGTPRDPNSKIATIDLVKAVRDAHVSTDVRPAFLDDAPDVQTAFASAPHPNVVILPFLIGGGSHATRDIPERLGLDSSGATALPYVSIVGGRRVVFERPVGELPNMTDVVVDRARECEHRDCGSSNRPARPAHLESHS